MVKIYESSVDKVDEKVEVVDTQSVPPAPKRRRVSKKSDQTPDAAVPTDVPVEKVVKEKTPAQLAAAERRKAAYALKKELKEAVAAQAAKEAAEKEEMLKLKQEEKAAKREAARIKRREQAALKRQEKEELGMPKWFEDYLRGVKKDETANKENNEERKVILKEIEKTAAEQWQNQQTRGRIESEVDKHKNRMYSMIFPKRAIR